MKLNEIFYALGSGEALAWSLIHSLWIGLIIWLVYTIIKNVFRLSASTKYYLAFGMQALLFLSFAGSFCYESGLLMQNNGEQVFISGNMVHTGSDISALQNTVSQESLIFQKSSEFVKGLSPYLSLFWLVGTFIMLLRFMANYLFINNLTKTGTIRPDEKWEMRFSELLIMSGIRKKVDLLESTLIESPITIGHFRPVILFPASMLSELPYSQLEAILLHEIAHIKRSDYLMNFIQNIVESLIFFHPVTWILSTEIRNQREILCDDYSVRILKDPMILAKALFEIQNKALHIPGLALGISDTGMKLKSRIERLLIGQKQQKNGAGAIIPSIVICLIMLGFAIFNNLGATKAESPGTSIMESASLMPGIDEINYNDDIPEPEEPETKVPEQPVQEAVIRVVPVKEEAKVISLTSGEDEINIRKTASDGRKIDITFSSPKNIQKLKIDGEKIKPEDYSDYNEFLQKEIFGVFSNKGRNQTYTYSFSDSGDGDAVVHASTKAGAQTIVVKSDSGEEQTITVNINSNDNLNFQMEDLNKALESMEKSFEGFDIDFDFDEETVVVAEEKIRQIHAESLEKSLRAIEHSLQSADEILKQNMAELEKALSEEEMQKMKKELEESMKQLKKEMAQLEKEQEIQRNMHKNIVVRSDKNSDRMSKMLRELENEGIIEKDSKKVNVVFEKGTMFVNGKKQDETVASRYMEILKIDKDQVVKFQRNQD